MPSLEVQSFFRLIYHWKRLSYSIAPNHPKQTTMKALFTVTVLVLLTGCSSLTLALKSVQGFYADSPKAKLVEIAPVDKTHASKLKTSPPSTTGLAGSTDIPPATATIASTPSLNPLPFFPTKILKIGSHGEAVLALEQQLTKLHYDAGAVDGFYDSQTWQGVVAFQKYAGLKRTGTYTLETQKALYAATLPEGSHPELGLPRIEINITRQVLLDFDQQGLNRVIAVSTGSNRNYCEISKKSGEQVCGEAHTPRGTFHIHYRIPGWRESDLGKLYNPLYFNGGFAIHGSPLVPAENVSHGCVRISIESSLWFYDTVKNGTPVIVFD